MKNKKKVVVVIGIAAILLVSIIGYLMYQKRAAEQAAVEEQFNQIYAIGTDFSAAKSREEQLDILKKTVNERNDYIQSKNNTPEVSGKYDSVILGMQGIFTKEYDTILEENTLEHVDESEDTEQSFQCSAKLVKGHAIFNVSINADYIFENGTWNCSQIEPELTFASADLQGEWKGTYREGGGNGTVNLNITEVDGKP